MVAVSTDEKEARNKALSAVLARNDRYLAEVVEGLGLCPYASACRRGGRLRRAVSWTGTGDIDRTMALVNALRDQDEPKAEVALLIFPNLRAMSPSDFDGFHHGVRAHYESRWTQDRAYHVVPFHPDYPCVKQNPGALVRFWRKSPEPTFQFVHIATLDRVRRPNREADISREVQAQMARLGTSDAFLSWLALQSDPVSTSEAIARANYSRYESAPNQTERVVQSVADLAPPKINGKEVWADVPWQVV